MYDLKPVQVALCSLAMVQSSTSFSASYNCPISNSRQYGRQRELYNVQSTPNSLVRMAIACPLLILVGDIELMPEHVPCTGLASLHYDDGHEEGLVLVNSIRERIRNAGQKKIISSTNKYQ